jgi:hypothetical protein
MNTKADKPTDAQQRLDAVTQTLSPAKANPIVTVADAAKDARYKNLGKATGLEGAGDGLKPYRCFFCLTAEGKWLQFESAEPVCPSCGADSRKPQHKNSIVPLELIHYLIRDEHGPIVGSGALYKLACKPEQKHMDKHCTGEPAQVTCPKCRRNEVHKADLDKGLFQGRSPQVVEQPCGC